MCPQQSVLRPPLNTFGAGNNKVVAVISCDADHRQGLSVSYDRLKRGSARGSKKTSQDLPRSNQFWRRASAEDTLKDGDLIMSRKLLTLAAAALLPLSFSAQAAETAKEGTDKFVVHFVNGQSFSPMKQGEAVVYTSDDYGIQSASAGSLFDNLGVRCAGIHRVEGEKAAGSGYCVKGDKDGNQYWEAYEDVGPGKGTSKIVGGLGKFAGMSGDIDYTWEPVSSPDDRFRFVVSGTMRWKLP
jgi:hypothetical protein